jgi:serine protease Do
MVETYHVYAKDEPVPGSGSGPGEVVVMSVKKVLFCSLAAVLASAPSVLAQDVRPRLPNFDRKSPIVLAVENVGPAVVSIRTQADLGDSDAQHPFANLFQRQPEEIIDGHKYAERSQGSGVILHPYGYVVTNYHVLWGSDRITVTLPDGGAGKTLEAVLINADTNNDVAILKIKAPGPYPYALMGDSAQLYVGETTIALGNPFGLASSVTTGVLSAKDRSVTLRGEVVFKDFMQTSALINPGNSGGPLLDINGYVIGINVAIDNRGPGIGYAIPINRVRDVAADLVDPEMVRHAWLGLDVAPDPAGLRVDRVAANSPAARAGVRKGDMVVSVGPKRVDSRLGYNIELLEYQPGAKVPLVFRRDRDYEVEIPFEEVPPEEAPVAGRRFDNVGLVVADITPPLAGTYGLDPKVKGVVITKVMPASIAQQMQLAAGDVVMQLGNYGVRDTTQLSGILRAYMQRSRGAIPIRVWRKGKTLSGAMPLE